MNHENLFSKIFSPMGMSAESQSFRPQLYVYRVGNAKWFYQVLVTKCQDLITTQLKLS